jgi:ferrous iron transport protein A
MVFTLTEIKPGHSGHVAEISGQGSLRHRIMAMGLLPGTPIRVERVAPLGDPIEISVRGYKLLIRKAEAHNIMVKV